MKTENNHITVIEDVREVAGLIERVLLSDGFRVRVFRESIPALSHMRANPPSLIILDLSLPDIDGMDVCRIVKNDPLLSSVPVVMVTGRKVDEDRGFQLGADDYVFKPFTAADLRSRVNAALKRKSARKSAGHYFEAEGLCVDMLKYEARADGRELELSPKLLELLCCFVKSPGRVHTKEALLETVWGYPKDIRTRTLETYVWRLRKSLGDKAHLIQTVTNVGYKMGG